MDAGKTLEEDPIASHRVINPRPDHGDDVQSAEDRHGDDGSDPRRCLVAKQSRRRHLGHSERAFHLGHGHGVDINDIDRQVERDHYEICP